jgi:hypothetical protein
VALSRLAVVVLPVTRAVDLCVEEERVAVVRDAEVLDAVAREALE